MPSLDFQHFRLLSLMRMFGAAEYAQFLDHRSAKLILGQHTTHSLIDHELGLCSEHLSRNDGLKSAGVTAVTVIILLIKLTAGQNNLIRIDDDNVIAGVDVGG